MISDVDRISLSDHVDSLDGVGPEGGDSAPGTSVGFVHVFDLVEPASTQVLFPDDVEGLVGGLNHF